MNRLGDASAFVIPAGQLLLTRRGKTRVYTVGIGVRANIHLGGGRPSFARMDSVGGGGSSRNFPGSILCGWQNFFS